MIPIEKIVSASGFSLQAYEQFELDRLDQQDREQGAEERAAASSPPGPLSGRLSSLQAPSLRHGGLCAGAGVTVMAELFAALGPDGDVRFVDEVPRGVACGCRCPECFSPLVAKQGEARAWHFAHEGGQERPECEVGAANLLRRLAIGILRSKPFELPSFSQRFGERTVTLEAQCAEPWAWDEAPARYAPAARSRLVDRSPIELYVEVSQAGAPIGSADIAVLSFVLVLPLLDKLQSRSAAEDYIRTTGTMAWRNRVDPGRVFARAKERFQAECAAKAAAAGAERSLRAAEAAQRRAQAVAARLAEEEKGRADDVAKEAKRSAALTSLIACTPRRAPESSLILYVLRDGSSWLFYSREDGDHALVQWPRGQANIELPQEVGTFDFEANGYRTTPIQATLFMRRHATATRTDSNPMGIAKWVIDNIGN